MIKKSITILTILTVLISLSSAAFVTIDPEGKGKNKVNKSMSAASHKNTPSTSNSQNFVNITGDTLEGPLDMAGFDLTGLSTPDDPSDAATKSYIDNYATKDYVDSKISSTSNKTVVENEVVSNLSKVLEKGNLLDKRLRLPNGLMFGANSSAIKSAFAIGSNSQALAHNSIAVGENVTVNSTDTMKVGSDSQKIDLDVSGDISVGGELEGLQNNYSVQKKEVWSYSFASDNNGTTVSVPEEVGNYSVSVTPIDSLASVGVFNKTDSTFVVKSSKFTSVDVMITESEK